MLYIIIVILGIISFVFMCTLPFKKLDLEKQLLQIDSQLEFPFKSQREVQLELRYKKALEKKIEKTNRMWWFFSFAWIGLIVLFFFSITYFGKFVYNTYYYETSVTTKEIVALNDNKEVNAQVTHNRYYYHSVISNDLTYEFYYKNPDGSYERQSIKADNTTIYEEDKNQTATWITYKEEAKTNLNPIIKFFLGTSGLKPDNKTRYELHVPKGTISNSTVLDNNSN